MFGTKIIMLLKWWYESCLRRWQGDIKHVSVDERIILNWVT